MRREIIQVIALVCLLVQGVLGSVASVAVLCLHDGSCGGNLAVEHLRERCDTHGCCQSYAQNEQAAVRPAIAISPPCDEDCQHCVDVGLPDLELASFDRVVVQAEDLSPDSMPLAVAGVHAEPKVPRLLPPATGPPDRLACLHAPIIRSTRLLI